MKTNLTTSLIVIGALTFAAPAFAQSDLQPLVAPPERVTAKSFQ